MNYQDSGFKIQNLGFRIQKIRIRIKDRGVGNLRERTKGIG
jgi:hypothetical protein